MSWIEQVAVGLEERLGPSIDRAVIEGLRRVQGLGDKEARDWLTARVPRGIVRRIMDRRRGRSKTSRGRPPGDVVERARRYLATIPGAVSGQGGHDRTFEAALHVGPGFELDQETCFRLMWEEYNPRCEPPWSVEEIRHKVVDAYRSDLANTNSGWHLRTEPTRRDRVARPRDPGHSVDPEEGQAVAAPQRLARVVAKGFLVGDDPTLVHWRDDFWAWTNQAWSIVPTKELDAVIHAVVEGEFRAAWEADRVAWEAAGAKGPEPTIRPVTSRLVADVRASLMAVRMVSTATVPAMPCWLKPPGVERPDRWLAKHVMPCRNEYVCLPSLLAEEDGHSLRPTPRLFASYALNYDHLPDAPPPARWLKFLHEELLPDDPEAVECLQEWFGYILTPDTSQHRIMLLIGPPRSGKGTISRVLQALIGEANTAHPTLTTLTTSFGLETLIGRPLAVVEDARFSGRHDSAQVVEKLLSISGEDGQTIERKYKSAWNGKLPTRFMLVSNELPDLRDASSALKTRILLIHLENSFLGREQKDLFEQLTQELPSILNWSIAGWRRLNARGSFVQPASGLEALELMEDLSSPVAEFVRECCVIAPDRQVPTTTLYQAYVKWCSENGRAFPGSSTVFGRNLRSAFTHVKRTNAHRQPDGKRARFYRGIGLEDVIPY